MKKQLFFKLCLLLALFSGLGAYAQLDPFTLTVTPTAQTCLGNGSLSFAVSGTEAGSSMAYEVYLLPNTTTPVATVTTNTVNSLVAGNYLIIATQSLGPDSNTATANVTITNNVQPLTYTIVPTHIHCPGDGHLTVNVNTGTAVSYQIISGPVTTGPQASNQFSNLPVGTYQMKVIDLCGNAVVVTVQLTQVPTSVLIDPVAFPPGPLPGCNTITVDHFFATVTGNEIFYPLTFEYTVFPPGGGAPIVITQTVPTGNNNNNHIFTDLPFYHDQQYTYNLEVTDACGNVFVRNGNSIDQNFDFDALPQNESCGNFYFQLAPKIYVSPYTVTFLSAPAGFNPASFNPSYPTHSGPKTDYGSDSNPVPFGEYEIQITDACGHTAVKTLTIEDGAQASVISSVSGETCLGEVGITVGSRDIVSVTITAAPQDYIDQNPPGLPDDVSGFIIPGVGFLQENLPMGTYTYVVVDECGDDYEVTVTIQPSAEDLLLTDTQRPGCAVGEGSIRLGANTNALTSVIITQGPPGFAVPADVSSNINGADGDLYMNSLPAGTYTFETIDNCGTPRDKTLTIQGYQVVTNNIDIIANCGSFNIALAHTSNGNYVQSFWLQEYNEANDTWGHPQTGVVYTDGSIPSNTNSVFLTNNNTNINLAYTGHFRILKVFYVYSNGAATNFRCTQVIDEFDFDGAPVIDGAYSFPCTNNTSEVIIDANGLEPLHYEITTKNSEPFAVDNGTSNLFSGLEPATYNFLVTDVCGSSLNFQLDINALDPIAIEAQGFCEGQDSSLSVQNFTFLDYAWYKDGAPGDILSTTNVLDFPGFDAADAGLYHVTISSDNPGSCINQTLDYTIEPNTLSNAGEDNSISVCNDGTPIDLEDYLSTPHDDGGTWADVNGTGAFTGTTFTTAGMAQGTYQFTYTVTSACGVDDVATISVQLKNIPVAPVVASVAPVCEGTDVQLSATAVPGAVYAWTGPGGYTSAEQSPLLDNTVVADAGTYSLTVTVNGCASPTSTVDVVVNPVPQFTIDGNAAICEGQSTVISVVPVNFTTEEVTFTWHKDGELLTDVTDGDVEVFEAGIYDVTVDKNGCSFSQQIEVILNINAFTVDLEAGCLDYNYVISIVNINEIPGASFSWSGPDGYSSTGEAADITNLPGGEYFVTVTNGEGCSADASIMVDNTNCFIPRGISPNDDQYNNSFDLSNLDVRDLMIFNRYGMKVYEKENYKNEWYGQSDKGELPTGTYFYVVTLSEGKQVTGWVYLQREVH